MAILKFKCPSCSTMLDVSDDSMGLKAPCPKCQAEISIPTISTPQKHRIVLSRKTADTLAERSHAPKKSTSIIITAFLGGIVIGVLISAFFRVPHNFTSLISGGRKAEVKGHVITVHPRSECIADVKHRLVESINTVRSSTGDKGTFTLFEHEMGEPDASFVVGEYRYWYFYCRDGVFIVNTETANKDYDVLNIADMGQREESYLQ